MPRRQRGWWLQDPHSCLAYKSYKSKLRQLDCRKNIEPCMSNSNRARRYNSSESKKLSSRIFKAKQRTAGYRKKQISYCNGNLRPLECRGHKEPETKHANETVGMNHELSMQKKYLSSEKLPLSEKGELEISYTESNRTEEDKSYSPNNSPEDKVRVADVWKTLVNTAKDDSEDDTDIFSPEYSPIKNIEEVKKVVCSKAKNFIPNECARSKDLDSSEYIRVDARRAASENSGISSIIDTAQILEFKQESKDDDITSKQLDFIPIKCNCTENRYTTNQRPVKEIELVTTLRKHPLNEDDCRVISLPPLCSIETSKENIVAIVVTEESGTVLEKVSEEYSLPQRFKLNSSLDENKGCRRYFDFPEITSDNDNKRGNVMLILKPIQSWQLPAEFTLSIDKYDYIRKCPVITCLSYLHRFPNSSPTSNWTFICSTPSKIELPNFIFMLTAITPLPVLYNNKLHQYFENFMNIYSEIKVGSNFILLNVLSSDDTPSSMQYPLKFSAECENMLPTVLLNKMEYKINKARPTAIIETESIKDSEFDNRCLSRKFGSFKFISVNVLSIYPEGKASVTIPFNIQLDSCICMFLGSSVTHTCPIKEFLLTITNTVQIFQHFPFIGNIPKGPLKHIRKLPIQSSEPISFVSTVKNKTTQSKKRKNAPIEKFHKAKRSKNKVITSVKENVALSIFAPNSQILIEEGLQPKQTRLIKKRKSFLCCEPEMEPHAASNLQMKLAVSTSESLYKKRPEFEEAFSRNSPQDLRYRAAKALIADTSLSIPSTNNINTASKFVQFAPTQSATVAIEGDVHRKPNSSVTLMNFDQIRPEPLTKLESGIPSDILEFLVSLPPRSQNAIFSIQNLLKIVEGKFTNINQAPQKGHTKSEQIRKVLINVITTSLIKSSGSLLENTACSSSGLCKETQIKEAQLNSSENPSQSFELVSQPGSASPDLIKSGMFGFMEVHFFEHIQGRNPNLRLLICVPQPINPTVLTVDKIFPNAILSHTVRMNHKPANTYIHVRKINTIREIESFLLDKGDNKKPLQSTMNGFDKQVFIFQPSHSKKMPPLTRSDFESLRRLKDSFIPNGMYLLTPVRKNGVNEIEILRKMKNRHLNDLKTEIGVCYNLGDECVKAEDLLNIPDNLFFASNVQLSDIF